VNEDVTQIRRSLRRDYHEIVGSDETYDVIVIMRTDTAQRKSASLCDEKDLAITK